MSEFALSESHVLLSGSAAANIIVRNYYDHFTDIRYTVDYNYAGLPESAYY